MAQHNVYVCLFVFSETMDNVALVRKIHGPTPDDPNGQKGKLNGIGGRLKPELVEDVWAALFREVKEETGYSLVMNEAMKFQVEKYINQNPKSGAGELVMSTVHYFYSKSQKFFDYLAAMDRIPDGDEVVVKNVEVIVPTKEKLEQYVWNTPYLLFMARVCELNQKWPEVTYLS